MNPRTWSIILCCALALTAQVPAEEQPPGAEQVTVTLTGGSKVTATLLRRNDQGVVLDLGHDVLHIPSQRILNVANARPDAADARAEQHDIFTVGRLDPAPVGDLVKRYGDSAGIVKTARGLGSGFVISDQGHVITNYHVVEKETKVSVTLFEAGEHGYTKREFKNVRIVAVHPLRDIALLQLDKEELGDFALTPLTIAQDHSVRVGDLVFTIGNPLGLERSVTQGIVSSVTRTMGHLRFIQTDAAVNPGNSGGPLFNDRGEVVAIVAAGAMMFDGLAFGIPSSDLIDFLNNRDAYVYDATRPQNGITYLAPPYRKQQPEDEAKPDKEPAK